MSIEYFHNWIEAATRDFKIPRYEKLLNKIALLKNFY